MLGLVVNAHPNVARADYDRLRAVLDDAARRGPTAADRAGHADFRAHLEGRISWITAANPARGPKLRAAFDAIDWASDKGMETRWDASQIVYGPPES